MTARMSDTNLYTKKPWVRLSDRKGLWTIEGPRWSDTRHHGRSDSLLRSLCVARKPPCVFGVGRTGFVRCLSHPPSVSAHPSTRVELSSQPRGFDLGVRRGRSPRSLDNMYRNLALYIDENIRGNEGRLSWMWWVFTASLVVLVAEVAVWLIAIAQG